MELVHESECEVGMVSMVTTARNRYSQAFSKILQQKSHQNVWIVGSAMIWLSNLLAIRLIYDCDIKKYVDIKKLIFTCAAAENNWNKKSEWESERSPASDYTWLASVSPGLNFLIHFHVTAFLKLPCAVSHFEGTLKQIFAKKRENGGISLLIRRRAGEKRRDTSDDSHFRCSFPAVTTRLVS